MNSLQVPGDASGDGASRLGLLTMWRSTHAFFFFRFFETESIAAITMMVSRYKIEIKEEPQFAGETFEERYARVTAFTLGLTNA